MIKYILERRRQAVINSIKLPSGYTALQYVICDGNQYIDTGVQPSNTLEVRGKWMSTSSTEDTLYGVQTRVSVGSIRSASVFTAVPKNKWYNGMNASSTSITNIGYASPSVTSNVWYYSIQNSSAVTLNGTSYNYSTSAGFNGSKNILLGGYLYYTSSTTYNPEFKGYIGEFIFLDGSTKLKHFVPAMNSSSQVGFYELVEGNFIQSAGTAFTAGPVK